MSTLQLIRHGREVKPRRVMLYGTHGSGKSTLASQSDRPIFIPVEEGINDILCDKFPLAKSFEEVMKHLSSLYLEEHPYRTLVLDTLDALEPHIWATVCREQGVEHIEELPYARGYTLALKLWRQLLEGLTALRDDKGMTILLIAHSKTERFENPSTESYDRYVPKLHKAASALISEWADEVLFSGLRIATRKLDEGFGQSRVIPVGAGDHVLYTSGRPTHIAKNRLGLPEELPLDWAVFAKYLPASNQTTAVKGESNG